MRVQTVSNIAFKKVLRIKFAPNNPERWPKRWINNGEYDMSFAINSMTNETKKYNESVKDKIQRLAKKILNCETDDEFMQAQSCFLTGDDAKRAYEVNRRAEERVLDIRQDYQYSLAKDSKADTDSQKRGLKDKAQISYSFLMRYSSKDDAVRKLRARIGGVEKERQEKIKRIILNGLKKTPNEVFELKMDTRGKIVGMEYYGVKNGEKTFSKFESLKV